MTFTLRSTPVEPKSRAQEVNFVAEGRADLLVATVEGTTEIVVRKSTHVTFDPLNPSNDYGAFWDTANPGIFGNPAGVDAVLTRMVSRSVNRPAVFANHGVTKAAIYLYRKTFERRRALPQRLPGKSLRGRPSGKGCRFRRRANCPSHLSRNQLKSKV